MAVFFLISLPLVNPWVRGDGVGYYAYLRAILIDRNLHFDKDWLGANPSFRQGRVDASGQLLPGQYAPTGYVRNHFAIGPSILWAPFLFPVHAIVLLADHLGAHIAADGYSRPYLMAMAASTALYGFAGLLLAFDLARRYCSRALGVPGRFGHLVRQFVAGLHVFQSVVVARAVGFRGSAFSMVLAPNAAIAQPPSMADIGTGCRTYDRYLLSKCDSAPGPGARGSGRISSRPCAWRPRATLRWPTLLGEHALFFAATAIMMLPIFVTRQIIYGSLLRIRLPFRVSTWYWASPVLLRVLFSSDHGMLSWTPILIPAMLGLIVFYRRDRLFGGGLLLALLAYYYFIASYPDWDGISSFGNRFFVSLTPVFVIGLAAALDWLAGWWKIPRQYLAAASAAIALWCCGISA